MAIPQLYVKEEFVGGCDIIKEMFEKGELQNLLKKHKIISSLTICNQGSKIWECSETTVVEIRKLTAMQIEGYLKKSGKQILQSVGCYQLEALGPQIIKDIKGDFFNVMGLPLFKLLKYVFNEQ